MIANGGERQQAYGAVNTSVGTHILAILVLSMRSDERQYMWPPRTAAQSRAICEYKLENCFVFFGKGQYRTIASQPTDRRTVIVFRRQSQT